MIDSSAAIYRRKTYYQRLHCPRANKYFQKFRTTPSNLAIANTIAYTCDNKNDNAYVRTRAFISADIYYMQRMRTYAYVYVYVCTQYSRKYRGV